MEETDGALAARLGRAQPVAAVGLLYATVFSAFGAFVKVAAAATVIMAVLGLIERSCYSRFCLVSSLARSWPMPPHSSLCLESGSRAAAAPSVLG